MNMNTKKITTVGILCAMAMIINLLISFPMVPAASFLRYDPKDIVIIIGGYIYGPMTVVVMSAITSILEIMLKGGTWIDVLMNMISTCTFGCMACYVYKKMPSRKGAIIGLAAGTVLCVISMLIWNYIVTPIYYQMPRSAVVAILLPGILPFNVLKCVMNAVVTMLLYKPLVGAFRHSGLVESSKHVYQTSKGFILISAFILVTIICIILAFQGVL